MLFSEFALYLEKIEKVSARLQITAILAELLSKLEHDEIVPACYLLQGRLLPPYDSLEFQLSTKMILRALSRIYSRESVGGVVKEATSGIEQLGLLGADSEILAGDDNLDKNLIVQNKFKQSGDIGQVAQWVMAEKVGAKNNDELPSLQNVYQKLLEIAREGGEGSQEKKTTLLVELFGSLDPVSARFIARIIMGKMRLGFSTQTMFDALSWATTGGKTESPLLEEAYQKKADIGRLAEVYLCGKNALDRQKALEKYDLEIGIPVVNALCQRLNSAAEVIEKMTEVLVEPKYDGLRIQVHIDKKRGVVRAFTRNLEDVSAMLPELQKMLVALACESCILDSEAVGFDIGNEQLMSFQQTITRKRKHDVEEKSSVVPLKFFVFDVLALDGKSLIEDPLISRKEKLAALFADSELLAKTPYIRTNEAAIIHDYHDGQLAAGLEGVVIKKIDSTYKSGRKGWRWVKIKEEEGTSGKLADTIDCVVMGYYFGKGKRTSFGIGAFLVGVPVQKPGEEISLVTIAKIGTGLTDDEFRQMKDLADRAKVEQKPENYQVAEALFPNVWVSPSVVVEIAADEVTNSPTHLGGVALRFPRLIKFRPDKNWTDATTLEDVKQLALALKN